jgi:hypothetical protein
MIGTRARPWGLAGGLVAGLLSTLGSGCRPGEGDRCFCHGECRGGLVCAAAGATLDPGQCVTDVADDVDAGVCIEGTVDSGGSVLDVPPFWDLRYDLPKMDFAPPPVDTDDSATTTTGDATGSTSSTSATDSTGGTAAGTVGTDSSGTGTTGGTAG